MKFGDTLRNRSIPQWAYQNVDYHDLKQAIKAHTTCSAGKPISIPGKDVESKAPKDFEDALYDQLLKEHTRVDQFVRSKAGELTRRLAHLDKVLVQLSQRWPRSKNVGQSVRRLERYSKLEDATLQVGQEVENLDRFISANCQAFRKILKKYRKWINSPDLEQRFHEQVLSRPTSFTNTNLISTLAHYNEILAAARASSLLSNRVPSLKGRSSTLDQKSGPHGPHGPTSASTAADIQYTYEHGSEVELDTALTVLPQGQGAGRACYWIHNDNLLQIQILLLQYMRSRKNQICTLAPTSSSSRSSRQVSIHGSESLSRAQTSGTSGVIVCDELHRFAERRSSEPLSSSEGETGKDLGKPSANIYYSSSGDAILTLGTPFEAMRRPKSPWQTARLKRKALGSLFDGDESPQESDSGESIKGLRQPADHLIHSQPPSNYTNGVTSSALSPGQHGVSKTSSTKDHRIGVCLRTMPRLKDAKIWLRNHGDVQPLVTIQSKRTRFAGTQNTDTSGFWATIDTEIVLSKCSSSALAEQYSYSSSSEESRSPSVNFPHAVLCVRFEGDPDTGLLRKLDSSHLAERVRGFSLDAHAVAVIYKPHRMPPPYWLPLLDQDIRKVPSDESSSKLKSNRQSIPNSGSPGPNSSSTTDGPNGSGFSARMESSETSILDASEQLPVASRKKRKLRQESLRRKIQDPSQRQITRYWNEYDDGDDADGNTYTIYIDPNASSGILGITTFSRLAQASSKRIKSLFSREKPSDLERQPLLGDRGSSPQSGSEDSDLEAGTASPPYRTSSHRNLLSSSPKSLTPAQINGDIWLTRTCIASFILSFVLLFIIFILVNASRRKAAVETDVGVVVGVAFSLALGIGGMIATAARRESVGSVWWVVVSLLFALVVVVNGLVLGIVL